MYSGIIPGTANSRRSARRSRTRSSSGSPASSYRAAAPQPDAGALTRWASPARHHYGFRVTQLAAHGRQKCSNGASQYGVATFVGTAVPLFAGVPKRFRAWMSHGDEVNARRRASVAVAHTRTRAFAAGEHHRPPVPVQFHPEVVHSPGRKRCCRTSSTRSAASPTAGPCTSCADAPSRIRAQVGNGRIVLLGALGRRVTRRSRRRSAAPRVGDRFVCIFVDHGLLRLNEAEEVSRDLGVKRGPEPASRRERRRAVPQNRGRLGPRAPSARSSATSSSRSSEARRRGSADVEFLAQGTLYPDVIESASASRSRVIKVPPQRGRPAGAELALVEPLRWLFKDEVRRSGRPLGASTAPRGPASVPRAGPRRARHSAPSTRDLDAAPADAIFLEMRRAPGLRPPARGRRSPCCCRFRSVGSWATSHS